MKIIDLLNKINNGEEVPKKVKFDNTIFEYDKNQKEYNHQNHNGYYETLLYRVMTSHFIDVLLRAEVEVIEEIDIQKIKPFIIPRIAKSDEEDMWTDRIIINKLIKAVKKLDNKLNKERKEKLNEARQKNNTSNKL